MGIGFQRDSGIALLIQAVISADRKATNYEKAKVISGFGRESLEWDLITRE
jgi:hypothetical protein